METSGYEGNNKLPSADPESVLELKTHLLAEGMSIDTADRRALVESSVGSVAIAGKAPPLTLAEYASTSGVILELPGSTYVNAPIRDHNPNFVWEAPPSRLIVEDGKTYVINGGDVYPARFVPVPSYYNWRLSDGTPVTWYANTHADRVRLSPITGCALKCEFCSIPYGREEGKPRYIAKSIASLIEATHIAMEDPVLPAEHIMISGGTPGRRDYGYENEVYDSVVEASPGVAVDIMMVPLEGLLDARRLRTNGVKGLSINMELWNTRIARRTMSRAKADRNIYLDFIEKAVGLFGRTGAVRSLLMVGIESIEDTLKGVEALAERGCDPVLSPFRPDPSTPLRNTRPPTSIELLEVWHRSRDIISRHPGVKLGPRCIPCMHNTLAIPDDSGAYYHSKRAVDHPGPSHC